MCYRGRQCDKNTLYFRILYVIESGSLPELYIICFYFKSVFTKLNYIRAALCEMLLTPSTHLVLEN